MLAVMAGIMIISSVGMGIIKKNVFSGIYLALNAGDYAGFFQKVDSKSARAVLPVYTRENLKLNAYMKQDKPDQAAAQFNSMMKQPMNPCQLTGLLVRGYGYFCGQGDGTKCRRIVQKMQEILSPEQYRKYKMHQEIVFEGSAAYLSELEDNIGSHRGKVKGYMEYLLARTYGSLGNRDLQNMFMERAAREYKTDVTGLEQRIEIM